MPHGARFVVELPAFAGVAHARPGAGDALQRPSPRADHRRRTRRRGLAADILELMGVKSRIITAWTTAEEATADFDPDIVFCDLRMPEANGLRVYREFCAPASRTVAPLRAGDGRHDRRSQRHRRPGGRRAAADPREALQHAGCQQRADLHQRPGRAGRRRRVSVTRRCPCAGLSASARRPIPDDGGTAHWRTGRAG